MKNFAVIFDMDGVVVDNTKYHILTWQRFAKQYGMVVSAKIVREKFMGRLGREIMKDIVHKEATVFEIQKSDQERERY